MKREENTMDSQLRIFAWKQVEFCWFIISRTHCTVNSECTLCCARASYTLLSYSGVYCVRRLRHVVVCNVCVNVHVVRKQESSNHLSKYIDFYLAMNIWLQFHLRLPVMHSSSRVRFFLLSFLPSFFRHIRFPYNSIILYLFFFFLATKVNHARTQTNRIQPKASTISRYIFTFYGLVCADVHEWKLRWNT